MAQPQNPVGSQHRTNQLSTKIFHPARRSVTMPPTQFSPLPAPQSLDKVAAMRDQVDRSRRIAIEDLINPSASEVPHSSAAQTYCHTAGQHHTAHFTGPTIPDPPRISFIPAQHITANSQVHEHGYGFGVTSIQPRQPGGTKDHRLWTMPPPEARPPSTHSSNGEGPSQPRRCNSTTSARSTSSSPAASLTSLSSLIPPAPRGGAQTEAAADLDFSLTFRQQPLAARACGLGDRDRRTIDPPPILELRITDKVNGFPVYDHTAILVLHCELRDAHGNFLTNLPQGHDDSRPVAAMMGNYVASPFPAKDERGIPSTFFILPDLSCRYPDRYTLYFQLLRLDCQALRTGQVAATALSDPFTVYTAKDFPGMRESTVLLKQLRRQGFTVGLKKGSEARKLKSKSRKRSLSVDTVEVYCKEPERHKRAKVRAPLPFDGNSTGCAVHTTKKRAIGN